MFNLKQLSLQGFRSFAEPSRVVFPSSGFVLIDGFNINTNGSSGSGKTSIVEAIAFALGYAQAPATVLQSHKTQTPLQVILTCDTSEGIVEIHRGKQNQIIFLKTGQTIMGAKNIAETINRLIGLPIELVAALTYRPQRSFGRFISMTDAEKKEFLTNCLPELIDLEAISDQAKKKAETLEQQKLLLNSTLINKHSELNRLQSLSFAIPHDNKGELYKQIEQLQHNIIQLESDKTLLAQKLSINEQQFLAQQHAIQEQIIHEYTKRSIETTKKIQERNSQLVDTNNNIKALLESNANTKRSLQQQLQTLDQVLQDETKIYHDLQAAVAQKSILQQQAIQLQSDLDKLQQNICPTCAQTWTQSKAQSDRLMVQLTASNKQLNLIPQLEQRLEIVYSKMTDICNQKDVIAKQMSTKTDNEQQIENLNEQKNQIQIQINILQQNQQQLQQQITCELSQDLTVQRDIIQKQQHDLQIMNCNISNYQQNINILQKQIETVENNLATFQNQINNHNQLLEELRTELQQISNNIEQLNHDIQLETSVYTALGRQGFLGHIFDEILTEISHEVTQVMNKIPNISAVTLKFTSSHNTKKGTTKQSIIPMLVNNGVEIPLSSLSGGQQVSVELAVDLAIGSIISRRTGKMPGWMIFDESMAGLDIPTEEACLEILKQYTQNRLILIIDHATEIKEIFDKTILIQFNNGQSTVSTETNVI